MEQESALKFPCEISVKVVGLANDSFVQTIYDCLKALLPALELSQIRKRYSKDEKYLSLTLDVYVTDREFIDAIYHAIGACPDVIMAL